MYLNVKIREYPHRDAYACMKHTTFNISFNIHTFINTFYLEYNYIL